MPSLSLAAVHEITSVLPPLTSFGTAMDGGADGALLLTTVTCELVRQPDSRPSVSYALTRYITDVVPKATLFVVLVAVP